MSSPSLPPAAGHRSLPGASALGRPCSPPCWRPLPCWPRGQRPAGGTGPGCSMAAAADRLLRRGLLADVWQYIQLSGNCATTGGGTGVPRSRAAAAVLHGADVQRPADLHRSSSRASGQVGPSGANPESAYAKFAGEIKKERPAPRATGGRAGHQPGVGGDCGLAAARLGAARRGAAAARRCPRSTWPSTPTTTCGCRRPR